MFKFSKKYKIPSIVLLGFIIGIFSALGVILPYGSVFGFFNTASFWSLSVFFIGTQFRSKRYSILTSVLFLSISVLTYYVLRYFIADKLVISSATLLNAIVTWVLVSIVLGTLFGLAGKTAKFSKDLKKRIVATSIPVVVTLTECIIAVLQLIPYLKSNPDNLIPFVIYLSLILIASIVSFIIFKNKKVAYYSLGFSIIISLVLIIILISLSKI